MNRRQSTIRTGGLAFVAVAFLLSAGCMKEAAWKPSKIFSLDNTWPWGDDDELQKGTPTRLVGTWTDTVLSQPGQKSQRGFGGRILFYERDESKPILVDGQLVVYAFDESGRDPTDNKPTRRYVFPAEQLPQHMSKSELGASYSVWLPWDEAGGPRTEVSLICRFEPKDGAVVTSEQTRQVLPGTIAPTAANGAKQVPKLPEGVPSKPALPTLQSLQSSRTAERQAQLASYEAPVSTNQPPAATTGAPQAQAEPTKHMTATTIPLPGSFQMPSAAIGNTPTVPVGSAAVPLTQPYPQVGTVQTSVNRTTIPTIPQQSVRQTPVTRPFMGTQNSTMASPPSYQPAAGGIGSAMLAQQPAFVQPTWAVQTSQPTMPLAGWNNSSAGPTPVVPQQFQQTPVGQPMPQQQGLQQPMLQPQAPVQQTWPQIPTQAGATTAVNYLTAGSLLR